MKKYMQWLHSFRDKHGQDPKVIPLSIEEIDNIIKDYPVVSIPIAMESPKLFGIDVEPCMYSESLRQKRLEIPISQFLVEYKIEDALHNNSSFCKSEAMYSLIAQMKSYILTDKTRLKITFEWDVWANVKRFLHIQKWFPIKTKTKEIDCLVLYPYCKITFPHNKHTVHFS